MFENINSEIPESLTYFLELLILKNKHHKLENLKLICTTISHCIMNAICPKSFVLNLQLVLLIFFIDDLVQNVLYRFFHLLVYVHRTVIL